MKKNKNIVIILSVILVVVVIIVCYKKFLSTGEESEIKSEDKNAIGITDISKDSYGYPLISLLSYGNKNIEVSAGIYRYGDVNQDGIINTEDKEAIELMIELENDGFSNGQIKLADLDENGKIEKNDIKMLEDYLLKNKEVKYNLNEKILNYCITEKNTSDSCVWQSSKTLKVKEQKDYYIFVKQTNNGRASESVFFSKENMNVNLDI